MTSVRRRLNSNSNSQEEESSPLLVHNKTDQIGNFNLQSWKYSILILLSFILSFWVCNNNLEPKELSTVEYNPKSGFNTLKAQEHLKKITNLPHDVNSIENEKVLKYLENSVKLLQTKTKKLSYILDNFTELIIPEGDKLVANFTTYYPISNLVARFNATNSNGKALLLSAHYDSRPVAPGATDNGIGVCVALEILRALINHPSLNYDILVNFNNGEESGLLGSRGFKYHPWYKDTIAFINLEGAGAGGKALLFQSSSTALSKSLIKGNYHHGNVIGNDLFKTGLISSHTDYQVYTQDLNLTGVDIAFYKNRAFYHTLKDDFEHAPIASINHMGNFIWQGVKNLGDSRINTADHPIYFDLFWSTIAVKCSTIYLLIGAFFLLEFMLIFSYFKLTGFNSSNYKKCLSWTINGLKLNLVELLVTVVVCVVLTRFLVLVNPKVIHSYPRSTLVFFLLLVATIKLSTRQIFTVFDKSSNQNTLISNWLATLLGYNLFVILQLISHLKGFSALYFVIFQALNLLIGFTTFIIIKFELNTVTSLIPQLNHSRVKHFLSITQPSLSYLINFTIGTTAVFNSGLTILMAGNQGAPTGSSDFLPYVVCLIFSTIAFLPLSPNFILVPNKTKKAIGLGLFAYIIYTMLLTRFPYSEGAPQPIHFKQVVELDPNTFDISLSTVILGINSKTNLLVDKLPTKPTKIETGVPLKKTKMDYVYIDSKFPELPKFNPKLDVVNKRINSTMVELQINFQAPETNVCNLILPTKVYNLKISQLTNNYKYISIPTSKLMLFRTNSNPWKLKFDFDTLNGNLNEFKLKATCYYNRMEELNMLVKALPNWVTFHNTEMGTLSVKMEYNLSLN